MEIWEWGEWRKAGLLQTVATKNGSVFWARSIYTEKGEIEHAENGEISITQVKAMRTALEADYARRMAILDEIEKDLDDVLKQAGGAATEALQAIGDSHADR